MNCDDVQNAIYVFLDGEFAPPEEADFRHHLDGCSRCRTLAESEARFLEQLQTSLDTVDPMPVSLKERIEASLREEPVPPEHVARARRPWLSFPVPGRLFWQVAVPAALVTVLVVGYFARQGAVDPESEPSVQHAVAAHRTTLPMEVRGSEEQVRGFLQDNVSFAVQIPFAGQPGVELVGARLTQVQGEPAILYTYDYRGRRLSVLQAADPVAPAGGASADYQLGHHSGFGFVTYGDRGVRHSVVGDMPERDLLRLVPASHATW